MYHSSMGNHSKHDIWLIDSAASCHMSPHREWFYEYEKYNGDVYLGDDSPANIIRRGRVKLKLKDGRVRTLPGVLHIPKLIKKLDICRKDGCCRYKYYVWRWWLQTGSRFNVIHEGSSVWNYVQTIGKHHH